MPSPAPEPLSPRPLSIWLVNPLDAIPGEGAAPMRVWSLARVLAGRGHDVIWWTATWSPHRRAIRRMPTGIREDEGFTVRPVAVRPYDRVISLARLASDRDFGRNFERLANETVASGQLQRPDIVLSSLPPIDGAEAALRVARRTDAVLVVDLVELWPEGLESELPGPAFARGLVAAWFLHGLERRRDQVVAAADALSATSTTALATACAAERLESGGPRPAALPLIGGRPAAEERPWHVCPVGAYPQEFGSPPRRIDAVPLPGADTGPLPPRPLQCVVTGDLDRSFDLDAFVTALRLLDAGTVPVTIHVVGTGSTEAVIRKAAASLRGNCRLELHGEKTRDATVRQVAGCDVGLVCLRSETRCVLPVAACEFASAGLALVNGLSGELQQLLDRHDAGVAYHAGNGASLADAITALASNRRRLGELREAARRLAAAEFDREITYAAFADWLETLCGQQPLPPGNRCGQ
jgi:glycosyltransferase involved in cell wall biosynthesis